MEEIWKDIKNYEGLYQISNFGRVKSLVGYNGHKYIKRNKILKQYYSKQSIDVKRCHICLKKNKKKETFRIHRLVAMAFIPNPENKPEVNHIDSNPLNNCVNNLEWVTSKENSQHALKYGRNKLNYDYRDVLYDYSYSNLTIKEILKKHSINQSTLSYLKVKHGITRKDRKYKYIKYKINLNELLKDFKSGYKNADLEKKYNCSKDIIATRKYQFRKKGLL